MRSPRGVSLVEVLVAALLLAIGVGGCVQALLAAGRLRAQAAGRERLARAVESRLAWFEGHACTQADTVISVAAPVEEWWRVRRDGAAISLEGRARVGTRGDSLRLPLTRRRRCP